MNEPFSWRSGFAALAVCLAALCVSCGRHPMTTVAASPGEVSPKKDATQPAVVFVASSRPCGDAGASSIEDAVKADEAYLRGSGLAGSD